MALSSLFYGMEAYLDGDVTINNNIDTPEEDAVAAADQSAEIASDVADASTEAKDNEIQAQMLVQASKLYTHVKTYGIDRTFLSIYNANGELDRACGVRFPSCETFSVTGNPRSQYSARFIAAMEDENTGFWAGIKNAFRKAWEWLKEKASWIWSKITDFWDWIKKQFKRLVDFFKRDKTPKNIGKDTEAAVDAGKQYTEDLKKADADKKEIERLTKELSEATARAVKAEKELANAQQDAATQKQELANAQQDAATQKQELAETNKVLEEINKKLEELQKNLKEVQAQAEAHKKSADERIKKLTEEKVAAETEAKSAKARAEAAEKALQEKNQADEDYRKQITDTADREIEAKRKAAAIKEAARKQRQKEEDDYYKKQSKQDQKTSRDYHPDPRLYVHDRVFANKVADLLLTLDRWSTTDQQYAGDLKRSIEEILLQTKAAVDGKYVSTSATGARYEIGADFSSMTKDLASEIIRASARLENILSIIQNEHGELLKITNATLIKIKQEIESSSVIRLRRTAGAVIRNIDLASSHYAENDLKREDTNIDLYGDSVANYVKHH